MNHHPHVHFRRLRHVALDEQERTYLLTLIAVATGSPPAVDVAKLKEKLS